MEIYFGNGSGSPQADRRYTMALQMAEWGDHAAAADLLRQALEMSPDWPPLHFHLGEALRQAGDTDASIRAFRDYLKLNPSDAMGATIKLSLLGAIKPPSVMPVEYVRSLFDQYAPKFEKSLVENLAYHTPDLMAAMVLKQSEHFSWLLDLGCGTGLAAQFFSGNADHMAGVDLAPAMIREARSKNLYEELHTGTLESFLAATPHKYDLVLAADVFVYIGALDHLFEDIAHKTRPGGLFCFSVQNYSGEEWILGADHRYAHTDHYIERCLRRAGFNILATQTHVPLRLDAGKPILGTLTLAQKHNPPPYDIKPGAQNT